MLNKEQLRGAAPCLTKVAVIHLVKLPAFFGTNMLISVFARDSHQSLSCTGCIESTPLHCFLNVNENVKVKR